MDGSIIVGTPDITHGADVKSPSISCECGLDCRSVLCSKTTITVMLWTGSHIRFQLHHAMSSFNPPEAIWRRSREIMRAVVRLSLCEGGAFEHDQILSCLAREWSNSDCVLSSSPDIAFITYVEGFQIARLEKCGGAILLFSKLMHAVGSCYTDIHRLSEFDGALQCLHLCLDTLTYSMKSRRGYGIRFLSQEAGVLHRRRLVGLCVVWDR